MVSADATKALVAFALFVTAIIFWHRDDCHDNLQDETGQWSARLHAATVALVLGVVFGALVIPPILDCSIRLSLSRARPAPRRARSSARAGGIDLDHRARRLGGTLNWNLIATRAGCGAAVRRRRIAPPDNRQLQPAAGRRAWHVFADGFDPV